MSATKSLNIALVLDDSLDKTDGVQQYVLLLGQWLETQGHQVTYLVGESHRTDLKQLYSLARNINVRFNKNRMSIPLPANKRVLREFFKVHSFDVVHVQVPYSPWLAHRICLAVPNRTVIVGTFHIVGYSKLVRWATRALAMWTRSSLVRFQTMLSVSEAAQQYAQSTYHMPSQIIPNACNLSRFQAALPYQRYADQTVTILFVGRLVERKGLGTLLQACTMLRDLGLKTPFRVLVCGTGHQENQFKDYVSAHGLENIVLFIGYISEEAKPRYYASSDIAVFPSSGGESFGIVLIEAMASGRSVVLAGDNVGYRSVLGIKPELLFPARDAAVLADRLAGLIQNPKERRQLAAWARDYDQQFDISVVGKQIVEVYTQALRNRPETEIIMK